LFDDITMKDIEVMRKKERYGGGYIIIFSLFVK